MQIDINNNYIYKSKYRLLSNWSVWILRKLQIQKYDTKLLIWCMDRQIKKRLQIKIIFSDVQASKQNV